jgi:hypothetical protein
MKVVALKIGKIKSSVSSKNILPKLHIEDQINDKTQDFCCGNFFLATFSSVLHNILP